MKINRNIWLIGVCWLSFSLSACSSDALHKAQEVVAQADSLRLEGKMLDDSIALAQAYETLGHMQWFYADDYAHACYHYGRLLRLKEGPVAAMQVFINATHAHSRDYQILGRIYNNMADIAHWADDYSLSYTMFNKSAYMYLMDNDTLSYYFCLNDMAFELTMLKKEKETLSILNQITETQTDAELLCKTLETKAELFLQMQKYDSAILAINDLCERSYHEPTGLLIKAQAFSYLSIKDSATYYANLVMAEQSKSLSDVNNALYILTNDDNTKDNTGIRQTAADRSDTQKLLEINQGKLSQAVQLLEQDIHKKPNLSWLYTLLATLSIIGGFIFIYTSKKRKRHQLLSQRIEDMENISQKSKSQMRTQIEDRCVLIITASNIKEALYWNDFGKMCQVIDQQFFMFASKLRQKQILNETEIRLCILVLLNMSRAEIAYTLPYAQNSIGKLKDHTAKSLGTTGKNLRDYLLNLAIEG